MGPPVPTKTSDDTLSSPFTPTSLTRCLGSGTSRGPPVPAELGCRWSRREWVGVGFGPPGLGPSTPLRLPQTPFNPCPTASSARSSRRLRPPPRARPGPRARPCGAGVGGGGGPSGGQRRGPTPDPARRRGTGAPPGRSRPRPLDAAGGAVRVRPADGSGPGRPGWGGTAEPGRPKRDLGGGPAPPRPRGRAETTPERASGVSAGATEITGVLAACAGVFVVPVGV